MQATETSTEIEASRLMKEGMALAATGRPEDTAGALSRFDRAIELRSRLPIDSIPRCRYNLAACWLNRAEALMPSGLPDHATNALVACNTALALLSTLPLSDDPRYVRRLAIAYQHRGLVMQARDEANPADAVMSFQAALDVLTHENATGIEDLVQLRATVRTNLANALLLDPRTPSAVAARDAARMAVALVVGAERVEPSMADIGLRARYILCQALTRLLPETAADAAAVISDDVHEATEAAEEGLALAKHWDERGDARFRELSSMLFRFGAHVYQRYQPQFLSEFVGDNVDASRAPASFVSSREMRAAAVDALWLSFRAGQPR